LTAAEVPVMLAKADVLVHVESFDYSSRRSTVLSMSTKIPEYLSSGGCIMAIGPKDIASIRYLKETKSAIVVTKFGDDAILAALKKVALDQTFRRQLRANAWKTAHTNHEEGRTRGRFLALMREVIQRNGPCN
jgi:hypothetical protein